MNVVDSIVAANCRNAVFLAYKDHRSAHSEPFEAGIPVHWLALREALNRHCLANRKLLPAPALWAELVPCLLLPGEDRAVAWLAEYAVYRTLPAWADVEWLGLQINPALHRLDVTDARSVAYLEDALAVYRPGWLALLSYETVRWVRRALDAARTSTERMPADCWWRGGPLWLKRGPGEVESEAFGSLQTLDADER